MLRAAAGQLDITPESPIPLGGYANRKGVYTRIADPLEINGVLLDEDGQRVIMLSLDTLYIGPDLRPAILDAFADELRNEELFLAASHTHFAPSIDASKPGLGAVTPAYLQRVIDQSISLIGTLLAQEPQYIDPKHGCENVPHNINRRITPLYTRRGSDACLTGPNPKGPCDSRLRRVELVTEENKNLATLWQYACHPVCFPEPDAVSAEFPGVVRNVLRHKQPDLPVLFFQGFSGDLRPRIIDTGKNAFKQRITGPKFGKFTPETWRAWAEGLARHMPSNTPQGQASRLKSIRQTVEPAESISSSKALPDLTVHGIHFAFLRFVGVAAEVVTAYGLELDDQTWPIGCMDDVFGYYPTEDMLTDGGYEVNGFQEPFDLALSLKPGLEAALRDQIRKVLA